MHGHQWRTRSKRRCTTAGAGYVSSIHNSLQAMPEQVVGMLHGAMLYSVQALLLTQRTTLLRMGHHTCAHGAGAQPTAPLQGLPMGCQRAEQSAAKWLNNRLSKG